MTRYIDADALKELWQPDHNRKFEADYFIHTIDNAPTADVVEVTDKSMESLIKGLEILGSYGERRE